MSHVGISLGNGPRAHAPTSGDVVEIAGVDDTGGYSHAARIARALPRRSHPDDGTARAATPLSTA